MKSERIALLLNSLVTGGAEIQMFLLAKALKEKTKFTPIIIGLTKGGSLEKLLQKEEIEYHILNFNLYKFHKKHIYKIFELFTVAKKIRKLSVNKIISRTYYPNMVGNLAGFLARVKYRYWFQVSVEWKDRNSKFEKLSARLANYFIANSEDAAEYLSNTYKIDRSLIKILPNVYFNRQIENSTKYWRNKLNVKEKDTVISLLSNFFPVKDQKTAIKAFAQLLEKYSNLKMILAGYAPDECNLYRLKALAFDLGLQNQLIFTGSTSDIQGLLSITDICLFTSLKKHTEGSPNIILDYMLAKKPIIASNIGPVRELFIKPNNCYFYEPENEFDLIIKIEILIKNPELRKQLGKENYKNVIKNHNENKYLNFVLEILK